MVSRTFSKLRFRNLFQKPISGTGFKSGSPICLFWFCKSCGRDRVMVDQGRFCWWKETIGILFSQAFAGTAHTTRGAQGIQFFPNAVSVWAW